MSSRAVSQLLRGGNVVLRRGAALTRGGGGAHRPPPPPFARLAPPAGRLHEETDLVWNDGVAPETLIDFDAAHIPRATAVKHLLTAFAGLGALMMTIKFYNPDSRRDAAERGKHLPDLRWERGEIAQPEGEM